MKTIKKLSCLLIIISVALNLSLAVSAARENGTIGNNAAAYDYTLRNPLLPWDCVKGYSSTTFIVDQSTINAGFSAYSYIYAQSNDGKVYESKTVYVPKGTNYANTGDVSINGYTSNCKSTHKSVYTAGGVSYTASLNSSL